MSSLSTDTENKDSKQIKNALLEVSLAQEQKELLLEAAQIAGCSLADFAVTNLLEVAKRTITEHQVMRLSQRDREVFVAALLAPPTPSEKLRSSAIRYKQRMGL